MSKLRPGRCYRKHKRPYTRKSKKKSKSYVKGAPNPKIFHFHTGNQEKDFSLKGVLRSKDKIQIRDNALEAGRKAANNFLEKNLGLENYHLWVKPYPHHIIRENPLASGAGADRFQEGMTHAFGKPRGRAAQVNKNQEIIVMRTDKSNKDIAKKALERASYKLPCESHISFQEE